MGSLLSEPHPIFKSLWFLNLTYNTNHTQSGKIHCAITSVKSLVLESVTGTQV